MTYWVKLDNYKPTRVFLPVNNTVVDDVIDASYAKYDKKRSDAEASHYGNVLQPWDSAPKATSGGTPIKIKSIKEVPGTYVQ